MEMRRLRALGFIQGRPDHGVRSLLRAMTDAGGKEIDVKDHFEITARGRDYLRLRAEMLVAGAGSGRESGDGLTTHCSGRGNSGGAWLMSPDTSQWWCGPRR
jgi:hypothetical protein